MNGLEAAVEIVTKALWNRVRPTSDAHQDAVEAVTAISRAGLLCTPAERRLVEASLASPGAEESKAWLAALEAIRAERAAREKPEPGWVAAPIGGKWGVLQNGTQWWTGFTESQARAVADALNREARP